MFKGFVKVFLSQISPNLIQPLILNQYSFQQALD